MLRQVDCSVLSLQLWLSEIVISVARPIAFSVLMQLLGWLVGGGQTRRTFQFVKSAQSIPKRGTGLSWSNSRNIGLLNKNNKVAEKN